MITNQEIEIGLPTDQIFTLCQHYGLRLNWDPFLKEMKFLDGAKEAAPGMKVWVKSKNGMSMTVEYITVVQPEYVTMKMISGPRIFTRFSGKWSFIPTENGCKTIFK